MCICHVLGWSYNELPKNAERLVKAIRALLIRSISYLVPYYTPKSYMRRGLIPVGRTQPENISMSVLANTISYEYQSAINGKWDYQIDSRAEGRLLLYWKLHEAWPGYLNSVDKIKRILGT